LAADRQFTILVPPNAVPPITPISFFSIWPALVRNTASHLNCAPRPTVPCQAVFPLTRFPPIRIFLPSLFPPSSPSLQRWPCDARQHSIVTFRRGHPSYFSLHCHPKIVTRCICRTRASAYRTTTTAEVFGEETIFFSHQCQEVDFIREVDTTVETATPPPPNDRRLPHLHTPVSFPSNRRKEMKKSAQL